MSAKNIINAFGYLLRNNPELADKNLENIRQLCQGKKSLDEVAATIGKWCQERGVYDKLLELNKADLSTKGDFICIEEPNATISKVQQFLIDNSLASLNRNEKQNDDPNKNDYSNQTNRRTKKY